MAVSCDTDCGQRPTNQVREYLTGDEECNAYDYEYDCGAIYHQNYMDVVGNRDHDCFWDCSRCKNKQN